MTPAAAPDLSVVIVSWNTRELLADCLASLPAAAGDLSFETVVVDNDSRDGTPAMIRERHPSVRLIESGGNLGFTRGNNLGFEHAGGAYVLLLNPDTVCRPGSLADLVAFAAVRPRLGAVGPTLVDADGRPTITYGNEPSPAYHLLELLGPVRRLLPGVLRRTFVCTPAADAPSSRVDYVAGACLLTPRAVLDEIGPLDERFFMYFEETDWCRRARAAGYEVWHAAGVEVVHLEGRAAARASRFSLDQFHKSLRLYLEKHDGPNRVVAFRAVLFLENIAKAAFRGLASLLGDRDRNLALAGNHRHVAGLQLRGVIEARPPGSPD